MKAARKGFNLIFKASKPMATRSIDKCALGYSGNSTNGTQLRQWHSFFYTILIFSFPLFHLTLLLSLQASTNCATISPPHSHPFFNVRAYKANLVLYDVPSFGHYMQHFFLFLFESVNVIVQNTKKNIINNFLFHELQRFY